MLSNYCPTVFDPTPWDMSESLFDTMMRPHLKRNRHGMMYSTPMSTLGCTDIIETTGNYCICIDLPGVPTNKVDVSVENGCLNVKAERCRPEMTAESTFGTILERSYGTCQRMITIPPGADENTAECKFENGVLTVSFSKKAPGHKLMIKEGTSSSCVKVNGK